MAGGRNPEPVICRQQHLTRHTGSVHFVIPDLIATFPGRGEGQARGREAVRQRCRREVRLAPGKPFPYSGVDAISDIVLPVESQLIHAIRSAASRSARYGSHRLATRHRQLLVHARRDHVKTESNPADYA